jgi:predicted alpha/beta hydrolase family esterase
VQDRVDEIIIFSSNNDMEDCMKSAEILHEKWSKSRLVTLPGKGHFCLSDLGTDAFPELLEVLNT